MHATHDPRYVRLAGKNRNTSRTIRRSIALFVAQCGNYNVTQRVNTTAHQISKHILNAQVSIRSPCCREWFDCAECHNEAKKHPLAQNPEMTFACKKCKKCFRKTVNEDFDDSDEYCPHCDNHFVIDAKTPEARLHVESEDVRMDARMLKDERLEQQKQQGIWDLDLASEVLG